MKIIQSHSIAKHFIFYIPISPVFLSEAYVPQNSKYLDPFFDEEAGPQLSRHVPEKHPVAHQ